MCKIYVMRKVTFSTPFRDTFTAVKADRDEINLARHTSPTFSYIRTFSLSVHRKRRCVPRVGTYRRCSIGENRRWRKV